MVRFHRDRGQRLTFCDCVEEMKSVLPAADSDDGQQRAVARQIESMDLDTSHLNTDL